MSWSCQPTAKDGRREAKSYRVPNAVNERSVGPASQWKTSNSREKDRRNEIQDRIKNPAGTWEPEAACLGERFHSILSANIVIDELAYVSKVDRSNFRIVPCESPSEEGSHHHYLGGSGE